MAKRRFGSASDYEYESPRLVVRSDAPITSRATEIGERTLDFRSGARQGEIRRTMAENNQSYLAVLTFASDAAVKPEGCAAATQLLGGAYYHKGRWGQTVERLGFAGEKTKYRAGRIKDAVENATKTVFAECKINKRR